MTYPSIKHKITTFSTEKLTPTLIFQFFLGPSSRCHTRPNLNFSSMVPLRTGLSATALAVCLLLLAECTCAAPPGVRRTSKALPRALSSSESTGRERTASVRTRDLPPCLRPVLPKPCHALRIGTVPAIFWQRS